MEMKSMLDEYREKVRHYMREYTRHQYSHPEIAEILDRLYDPSGKMIRAIMLILCAKICAQIKAADTETDTERPFRMAALIELTHYSSLVHDDIIDDSAMRRNKPSIQGAYGKTAAVLAGDILLSRIYYNLLVEGIDEISFIMTKLLEEMCVGEIVQDIRKYDPSSGMEDYMTAINGKTARLFCAACKVGCICMDADEKVLDIFTQLGEKMGHMFQIRDDYLDYMSDKGSEGKDTDKDFYEGIYTYPLLAVMESQEAKTRLETYFEKNSLRELTGQDFKEVKKIIEEFDGFRKTKECIDRLAKECSEIVDTLEGMIPEKGSTCQELKILRRVIDNVRSV